MCSLHLLFKKKISNLKTYNWEKVLLKCKVRMKNYTMTWKWFVHILLTLYYLMFIIYLLDNKIEILRWIYINTIVIMIILLIFQLTEQMLEIKSGEQIDLKSSTSSSKVEDESPEGLLEVIKLVIKYFSYLIFYLMLYCRNYFW